MVQHQQQRRFGPIINTCTSNGNLLESKKETKGNRFIAHPQSGLFFNDGCSAQANPTPNEFYFLFFLSSVDLIGILAAVNLPNLQMP